jgi:hypothetical protein
MCEWIDSLPADESVGTVAGDAAVTSP